MKLVRISQDAHLVQPLSIDGHILCMNSEDSGGKFRDRTEIVHLLPNHMRWIVIEPKVCARNLCEHSPPDRRAAGQIFSSWPFVGGKQHRAVLNRNPNPLLLSIRNQVAPNG